MPVFRALVGLTRRSPLLIRLAHVHLSRSKVLQAFRPFNPDGSGRRPTDYGICNKKILMRNEFVGHWKQCLWLQIVSAFVYL